MALKAETKTKLLGLVKAGHDLESACAALNLSPGTIRKDKKLAGEIAEAFLVGTARLRARLFQSALDNNDTKILGQMLEQREAEQKQLAVSSPGQLDFGQFSDDELQQFEMLLAAAMKGEVPARAAGSEACIEQMRAELLAEAERYARAMEPLPVRPIDEVPVLNAEIPLPPSKAPAVRPAVEILPPARRNDSTGRPMALSDPGSPWYDGGARDLRKSERI
jgi:hypothetical protein